MVYRGFLQHLLFAKEVTPVAKPSTTPNTPSPGNQNLPIPKVTRTDLGGGLGAYTSLCGVTAQTKSL